MASIQYENVAQVYARLIKEGKRSLESIANVIVRERVRQILADDDK